MAEAFTAGVRPGGLTDDTQIRMLLCYLVKVAGPVKRETMQGALLQEQLVNYFEFADALAEVEKQQLVTVDEDGGIPLHAAAPPWRTRWPTTCPAPCGRARSAPSCRSAAGGTAPRRTAPLCRRRTASSAWSARLPTWAAMCSAWSWPCPDKLTAEMIKNNFIAHGSDIFPKLLNALTQPGSEDDRPPAGLM